MKYVMYKDRLNQWRWQLISANSKIIADSGEGYFNKADCLNGINLTKGSANAPVYER